MPHSNPAHNSDQTTQNSTSADSQPANTNQFEPINLTHRLVDTDMSSTVALVDNVTSATDKAISILSLIAGGIDGNVSKVEEARYFALDSVIDLLKDIDAILQQALDGTIGALSDAHNAEFGYALNRIQATIDHFNNRPVDGCTQQIADIIESIID